MMSKKTFLAIILSGAILLVVTLFIYGHGFGIFGGTRTVGIDSKQEYIPTPAPSQESEALSGPTVITFTDGGFSPATVNVKRGDSVVFKNKSSEKFWPAANPHPAHSGYPEDGGCISSMFDACAGIPPDSSWSFTFNEIGTWGYHDHLNSMMAGKVIVRQ